MRPDPAALRDALLARVRSAAAEACGCGEDAGAGHCLDHAADEPAPTPEEILGLYPDPGSAPPDGEEAWLADLPSELVEEYLHAVTEQAAPEALRPGLWDRGSGGGFGFGCGGVADDLPPGPALAGFAADVWERGLAQLADDELIGVLRAARRLDMAMALQRLPQTAKALASGDIDVPRAIVIADETALLSSPQLRAVEEKVLARAPGQTASQVRRAARRAVIAADAGAARQRKEHALREARVERWNEAAGTAALAGRDLSPAQALVADRHLTAVAQQLQAAGVEGTMDNLRARAFLALLAGQTADSLLAGTEGRFAGGSANGPAAVAGNQAVPAAASASRSRGDSRAAPPALPGLSAAVNLTLPMATGRRRAGRDRAVARPSARQRRRDTCPGSRRAGFQQVGPCP